MLKSIVIYYKKFLLNLLLNVYKRLSGRARLLVIFKIVISNTSLNKRDFNRLKVAMACAFFVPLVVFVIAPAFGWNCIEECDCTIYNEDPTKRYCKGLKCSQMMTPFTTAYVLVGGLCLLVLLILSIIIYFHIFIKVCFRLYFIIKKVPW